MAKVRCTLFPQYSSINVKENSVVYAMSEIPDKKGILSRRYHRRSSPSVSSVKFKYLHGVDHGWHGGVRSCSKGVGSGSLFLSVHDILLKVAGSEWAV